MWIQKKQNKYGNVRQTYNGYSYASKKEAQKAWELDLLLKSGEIKEWLRQFKLPLYVNGVHIANYYCDFLVRHNDGTQELIEIKSPITMTEVWRIKWKLTEALFGDRYKLTVET